MARKSRSRRSPTLSQRTPITSGIPALDFTISNEIIASLPANTLYSKSNRGPILRAPSRILSVPMPLSPEILAGKSPTPQVQAARMATMKTTNGLPSIETRKPFVEYKTSTVTTTPDDRRCNKRPDSRSSSGSGRSFVPWKAKPC